MTARNDEESHSSEMRIFIGQISESLADQINQFETILAQYGELVGHAELRRKPASDLHFAYITMNISKEKYQALKSKYSGRKFKGSNLIIDVAKPDYQAVWAARNQEQQNQLSVSLNPSQLKRLYQDKSHDKNIISGRLRENPRKNLRYATYRVTNKKGKSVVLRCSKKKLWGYMRDRNLSDLSWSYQKGRWLSGRGDTIEMVDYESFEEEEDEHEQDTNAKIFEQLFKNRNEELGRISLNDDDEENHDVENAAAGGSASTSSDDDQDSSSEDGLESQNTAYKNEIQSRVVDFDDQEEASMSESQPRVVDFDDQTQDETNKSGNQPEVMDFEVTNDPEPESPITADPMEEVDMADSAHNDNPTEKLRSLFNPEETGNFKMFGADASDEEDEEPVFVPNKKYAPPAVPAYVPKINAVGLFFPHFESPFLNSQSQVISLSTAVSEPDPDREKDDKLEPFSVDNFRSQFWDKRGEMNRELRRKRRDVLRHVRKRNNGRNRAL